MGSLTCDLTSDSGLVASAHLWFYANLSPMQPFHQLPPFHSANIPYSKRANSSMLPSHAFLMVCVGMFFNSTSLKPYFQVKISDHGEYFTLKNLSKRSNWKWMQNKRGTSYPKIARTAWTQTKWKLTLTTAIAPLCGCWPEDKEAVKLSGLFPHFWEVLTWNQHKCLASILCHTGLITEQISEICILV